MERGPQRRRATKQNPWTTAARGLENTQLALRDKNPRLPLPSNKQSARKAVALKTAETEAQELISSLLSNKAPPCYRYVIFKNSSMGREKHNSTLEDRTTRNQHGGNSNLRTRKMSVAETHLSRKHRFFSCSTKYKDSDTKQIQGFRDREQIRQ